MPWSSTGEDCWPVNNAAIYGQEVEPPADRQRLARGVPGGLGRSPDAAGDTDVVEMGGRQPRWPGGSTRGPAFSVAVAALVAGLLLGFIGGHLQSRAQGTPPRPAPRYGRRATPHSARPGAGVLFSWVIPSSWASRS